MKVDNDHNSEPLHTRRVATVALVAAALYPIASATSAFAQAPGKAAAGKGASKAEPFPNQGLFAASQRCGKLGTACLNHSLRLTRAGDKTLGDCIRAIRDMLPVAAATGRLAALNSKHLKETAKLCADVCTTCEAECRKHEFHHKECAACAAACADMVAECKKVMGA